MCKNLFPTDHAQHRNNVVQTIKKNIFNPRVNAKKLIHLVILP